MYNNDYDPSTYDLNADIRTEIPSKQNNDDYNQKENQFNINEIITSNKKDSTITINKQNQNNDNLIISNKNENDINELSVFNNLLIIWNL